VPFDFQVRTSHTEQTSKCEIQSCSLHASHGGGWGRGVRAGLAQCLWPQQLGLLNRNVHANVCGQPVGFCSLLLLSLLLLILCALQCIPVHLLNSLLPLLIAALAFCATCSLTLHSLQMRRCSLSHALRLRCMCQASEAGRQAAPT
jgi:hypothetical protein